METAMELALRRAREEAIRASQLRNTVSTWAADDHVHEDPPLPPAPPAPQENAPMSFDPQPATAPVSAPQPSGGTPSVVSPHEGTITYRIWRFIKDNPGIQRKAAVDALVDKYQFNRGSVSSLIGQMVLQRYVFQSDPEQHLTSLLPEFRPLVSGKVREALVEARRRELARTNPKEAARGKNISAGRKALRKQATPPNYDTQMASLVKAREVMAKKREDPRFRMYLSETMRHARARMRGESYPMPKMPDLSKPLSDSTRKRLERELARRQKERRAELDAQRAEAAAKAKPTTHKENDPMTATKQTLTAVRQQKAAQTILNADAGGLDAVHRAAQPVPPAGAWPGPNVGQVNDIVSAVDRAPADLRRMSSDEIVQALSITQARDVFNKLREFFGA